MTTSAKILVAQEAGGAGDAHVTSALLADDDDDARCLIAGILRRAGFQVIEASDGRELVERYDALIAEGSTEPAVVVSDIGMPGCDGISATQRLRSSSHVPIVLITAFDDAETLNSARSAGANLVLFKPVDGASLMNAIRSVARQ